MNRRTVLKSSPLLVTLSAGCTGGEDQESTPTSTPTETMADQTPTPTPEETPVESTPTATPSYEEALADLTERAEEEGALFVRAPASAANAIGYGEFLTAEADIEFEAQGGSNVKHIAQSITEMSVGKLKADLINTTDGSERILAMEQDAMMNDIYPPIVEYGEASDTVTRDWDENNQWVYRAAFGSALAYNTNLVSADEVPKTFDEMLDPKWENSFMIDQDGVRLLDRLMDIKGSWEAATEWMTEFRPQIKQYITSNYRGTIDLADGRAKFMIHAPTSLVDRFKNNEGSPVDYVFPDDTAHLYFGAFGIFKDAPHPNAAKLYLNHVAKMENQASLMAETGAAPMDPEFWPAKWQEVGNVTEFDVPYLVESTQITGLSRDQMHQEYQTLIGV